MKPSKSRIKKEIKALRKLVDDPNDVIISRIAYAMENTLRWATEDTMDWPPPSQDVLQEADILKSEIL